MRKWIQGKQRKQKHLKNEMADHGGHVRQNRRSRGMWDEFEWQTEFETNKKVFLPGTQASLFPTAANQSF